VHEQNREIDNQIISKYSNRVPKASKPHSVDRTKHKRDMDQYKKQHSHE